MTARVNPDSREFTRRMAVLALVVGFSFLPIFGLDLPSVQAVQDLSSYDLIAAVNQLREANNLPPYQINPALMKAAQAHSEYQASIGNITHTGKGGTSAQDRAVAAGYGGGGTIFVSENIAGGSSLTPQGAVQIWQGDSLHLNTMLGTSYTDVGAGVAKANGGIYYTLNAGYVAGSPAVSTGTRDGNAPPPLSSKSTATQIAFFPVALASPAPDGSVTHIVKAGQTLWTIAAMYKIDLEEILALNNLPPGAFIFPGDELLIKASEATPTATEVAELGLNLEAESTVTPTVTRRPMRTLTTAGDETDIAGISTQVTAEVDELAKAPDSSEFTLSGPFMIIAILVLGGTGLIILGNLLNRSG